MAFSDFEKLIFTIVKPALQNTDEEMEGDEDSNQLGVLDVEEDYSVVL